MSLALIEIKKASQDDLRLFKNALNDHASFLQTMIEMDGHRNTETFQIKLSITVELFYDLHKKTEKQIPSKKPGLKLPLHKAIVLKDALRDLLSQKSTVPLDRSRATKYYQAIDQELPTNKLIISQAG